MGFQTPLYELSDYRSSCRTSSAGTNGVEKAMGKAVQRDVELGMPEETPDHFDAEDVAVIPDEEED